MSAERDEVPVPCLGLDSVRPGHPAAETAAAALVGQALDDLAAERVDVADALELVATMAWQRGHDFAALQDARDNAGAARQPHDDGIGGAYVVVIVDPATGEVDIEGPFPAVEAMVAADRTRLEMDASGLSEFTVTLSRLRRPR